MTLHWKEEIETTQGGRKFSHGIQLSKNYNPKYIKIARSQ